MWAAFAAVLLRFKQDKLRARTGGLPLTFRNFLGVWTRSLGHTFLALSTQVTIQYLSFAPAVIAEVEGEFQDKMAFARQPSDHWSEVEQSVQRVRSKLELIEHLRAAVNPPTAVPAIPVSEPWVKGQARLFLFW